MPVLSGKFTGTSRWQTVSLAKGDKEKRQRAQIAYALWGEDLLRGETRRPSFSRFLWFLIGKGLDVAEKEQQTRDSATLGS